MNLKDKTVKLKETLNILKNNYLTNEKPENKKDKAFFDYVREQTKESFDLVQEWEEEALRFVKNRQVRVHPQQIASTKENIELLLMHSYYIDVRRKRYMELNQSVHYVFDALLVDLE